MNTKFKFVSIYLFYLTFAGCFSQNLLGGEFDCLETDGQAKGFRGPKETPLSAQKIKEVMDFFESWNLEGMSEDVSLFGAQLEKIEIMFPETQSLFVMIARHLTKLDEENEPSNLTGLVLLLKHFSFTHKYTQINKLVANGKGSLITHRIWTTIQTMKRNGTAPETIINILSYVLNAIMVNDPHFPVAKLKDDIRGYLHEQTMPDHIAVSKDAKIIDSINMNIGASQNNQRSLGLIKLGYSQVIAQKLLEKSPKIAAKIEADPSNSKPVKLYRGFDIKFKNFDPKKMNNGIDGFGGTKNIWVTSQFETAFSYALKDGNAFGIIVEYEVPQFMVIQESGGNAQIRSEYLDGDQSPFINRTAILDGQKFSPIDAVMKIKSQDAHVQEWR